MFNGTVFADFNFILANFYFSNVKIINSKYQPHVNIPLHIIVTCN